MRLKLVGGTGNEAREFVHVHLTALICMCVYFLIREVKDRDEINEFLRNEIRLADMKAKVRCVAIYAYLTL